MNKSVFPERQKSFVAVPLSFLRAVETPDMSDLRPDSCCTGG